MMILAAQLLLAALAEAQFTVKILTPYFLPDNALVTALNLAALRASDGSGDFRSRLDFE